eukprot:COSAG01_NODE_10419_length_2171_cov_3.666988_2_plen_68_part_00
MPRHVRRADSCGLACARAAVAVARQHEHLEQWQLALAAYGCAADCAAQCLGTAHAITRSLTQVGAPC